MWLSEETTQLDLQAALAHYEAQGYARLGRVLTDEGLQALRSRAEDLMLGRVTYPGMFFQMDAETGRYEDAPIGKGWQGPSLKYRKLEKLELDDRFRAWLSNPLFERIAQKTIGGDITLYRAIIFNKGPGGGSDIPWHQDGGKLWGLSEDAHLQIWTALHDAPEGGGCIEVAPGTHKRGLASPLGGVVPAELTAQVKPTPLPVKVGEALLIHNYLWHRSGRGREEQHRQAFSACYMSSETRCLRTRKTPRTFPLIFKGAT